MTSVQVNDDYYAILGVEMTADAQVIRNAYHRLARITHPDKNPSPNGKEQFQKLQEAYETLSDSTKRKKYDIAHLFVTDVVSEAILEEMQARAEAQTQLSMLQARWTKEDKKLFNMRRDIKSLEAEITKLEEEETSDAKEWLRRASWLGSMAAALFGVETAGYREAKGARDRRRLDRITALHEKVQEKDRKTRSRQELESTVYKIGMEIYKMKRKYTKMWDWLAEMEARKHSESQARSAKREAEIKRAQEAEAARKQRQRQEKKDEGARERERGTCCQNVREVRTEA
ncbi:hypothetical protein F5Y08DRAFT_344412 [Xylaria arbuscula]|nr:hypothetical protein F5Y08DRAFT_344412 [Xylaria arbuscula]